VREIHCFKTFNDCNATFEVSILFNNEQLRRHKILNIFYEKFRLFFYSRVIDIESFRIYLSIARNDKPYFAFENIYSGNHRILEDAIHEDKTSTPHMRREISNYFVDVFHPIVFINTSNHAMAEKDNNETCGNRKIDYLTKNPQFFSVTIRERRLTVSLCRMLLNL
jgi:hypothetical protein